MSTAASSERAQSEISETTIDFILETLRPEHNEDPNPKITSKIALSFSIILHHLFCHVTEREMAPHDKKGQNDIRDPSLRFRVRDVREFESSLCKSPISKNSETCHVSRVLKPIISAFYSTNVQLQLQRLHSPLNPQLYLLLSTAIRQISCKNQEIVQ